ncbi:PepSY domain-containing protein [Pseudoroseomonas cervicalis]|uniref:PepSY-associated TM helix domain-containing protein n=1 Tax=Teichococcus cervicalis TaxID=204525 RepID=UPI0022F158B4|nr:PepSY-associated TM helix domain-containing protein [Pseudoroseomonas cervicalis]WBV42596.1 PepSY-associated TM helix domain-containing protein [Pseudoroseomonas cervicalis]
MSRPPSPPPSPGLRQSMAGLHRWAGLLAGWLLYAMFLTGTVAYFKDEISLWMRPELPAAQGQPDQALAAQRVAAALGGLAPGAAQWSLRLPDARNPDVDAFWRGGGAPGDRRFGAARFDAATGTPIAARETQGGEFFLRFHFQFHYMPVLWGRWLAGAAAMLMLVAILSGVITHRKIFVDFFTFRWGKGPRAWLDAHNALSVFGLPFHLMITYTGLVTLMALYMPWGERAGIRSAAERQEMSTQLSAFLRPGRPSGEAVPLAPIDAMVRQAEARWGQGQAGRVTITLPGDAAARVAVSRGEAGRISMSPQYLEFSGASGALLSVRDSVGAAAEARGVLYALHLGRFSDTATRWLYFLVSLAGTAMVGTGLVLWAAKRRAKLAPGLRAPLGLWLVERLNIAGIAGLSVAMAGFLWANRLLPASLPGRAVWEVDLFFILWGLALLHALLRPARRAWLEQLWLAAALLALLPLLSAATTDRPLWRSLAQGDWVFAGLELTCLALAALHAALALGLARHRGVARAAPGRGRGRLAPGGQGA